MSRDERDDVGPFHKHLNSINPHIHFTLEMASTSTGNPTIAFLDTNSTALPDGRVEVNVYIAGYTHEQVPIIQTPTAMHRAKSSSQNPNGPGQMPAMKHRATTQ